LGFFEEGSASFLKKRSKKLSVLGGVGNAIANARSERKFFGYFFSKK
jgi:hypothetical protein